MLFGCLSLLWLWPWSRAGSEPAVAASPNGASAPADRLILRQRGLWGASLGHFAGNYNFYFILAWLPEYLVKARGIFR